MCREKEERGPSSIKASIRGNKDDLEKSKEGLVTDIRNRTDNIMINRLKKQTKKQKWEGKQLYNYLKR